MNRIEKVLETFIKRPDVTSLNVGDDWCEEMFKKIKGPSDDIPLAATEKQNESVICKQLADEACTYVCAGMNQFEFYDKHETCEVKRNVIMKNSFMFNNLWKNYSTWKVQEK